MYTPAALTLAVVPAALRDPLSRMVMGSSSGKRLPVRRASGAGAVYFGIQGTAQVYITNNSVFSNGGT